MEHPENNEEYKGLTVNKGIEQPSSINPYLNLRKKPKRRQFTVGEYVEGIVKGDVTVLSQAVTLVESVKPDHQQSHRRLSKNVCRIQAILSVWVSVVFPERGRVRRLMYSVCMYWNVEVSWLYWLSTRAVSVRKEVFGR